MSRTAFRTCPLCEATCGLRITVEDERVKVIRGDRDNVFSAGFICPKGTTLGKLHADQDRLTGPLVKRDGAWEEVSWDEAFAVIDERYQTLVSEHGRQSVAAYLGNPNVHSLDNGLATRPFVRALRTRNVYSASTVDQMPKHVSSGYMFGHPAAIPVPDIDRTDFLVVLGANPYESNGSLATAPDWPGRLDALRDRGGTLVVVDPRRTKTAENADRHLSIRPGTDAALLVAMLNHLVESGQVEQFEWVEGVDRLETAVAGFTPERVAGFCDIDPSEIRRLADDVAAAESACVYGRIGTHTVEFGTVASWAVDALNIVTGNLDRPGGAMFPKAAHQPASRRARPFKTGRWQSRVRGLPEVLGELPVITLADEIQTEGTDRIRALFVIGGNPALTNPDSARLGSALGSLEFMVSIDPYLNETSRLADVILPPPSALERPHYDYAFTGLSVRNYAMYSPVVFETDRPSEFDILVRLTAIVSGLGPDADPRTLAWENLAKSAGKAASAMGLSLDGMMAELSTWDDPRLATLDLQLRTGAYGDGFGRNPRGLSLQRLIDSPHGVDFGPMEPRLDEAIATESGMVDVAPVVIVSDLDRLARAVDTFEPNGMVLIGRRQLRTANSWLGNVEVLVKGREACTLQVHPEDAVRLDLTEDGSAMVTSAHGTVEIPVEITDSIRPGVVSIPYGWGHDIDGVRLSVARARPGVNVNVLTGTERFDPLSGNAVLNAVPVTVSAS